MINEDPIDFSKDMVVESMNDIALDTIHSVQSIILDIQKVRHETVKITNRIENEKLI